MQRHWVINGRFLAQPATGVQRYASEIVRALDEAMEHGHPLTTGLSIDVVVPRGERRDLPLKIIRTVERGPLDGHAWEQAVLPAGVRGGLLSLGNTGPVVVRHQIVCLHDLSTRTFPRSYSHAFRAAQRVLPPLLGRTVGAVATVSHASAADLVRFGVCGPDKLVVIPNGHEHVARWVPHHSRKTLAVAGRRTIVVIGTPAPHKNVGLIVGLAPRLASAGLQVALVGGTDPKVFRPDASVPEAPNVRWLGRLTDGELAALLGGALCLAFPSYSEGFGLPPLEAMALGCPVVASDRTSLPEVCGEAAILVSPDDPAAWFAAFLRLRDDAALRACLARRGPEQARSFSWAASARLYLEAMRTLDARASPGAKRQPAAAKTAGARIVTANGRQGEPTRDA